MTTKGRTGAGRGLDVVGMAPPPDEATAAAVRRLLDRRGALDLAPMLLGRLTDEEEDDLADEGGEDDED